MRNLLLIFVCVCSIILAMQLIVPPQIGLADNGDFARVMVFFNLTHSVGDPPERYFSYLDTRYVFDGAEARKYSNPDYWSSELLFAALAVGLDRLFHASWFPIALMGAVQAVCLVFCVFLIGHSIPRSSSTLLLFLSALLTVFVFFDDAYTCYFNSFYMESATFLFFFFLVATRWRAVTDGERQVLWCVLFFVAGSLFVTAKLQNLSAAPFLAFAGWRLAKQVIRSRKYLYVACAGTLLLAFGTYKSYRSAPEMVIDANLYNTVFNGILVDSASPEQDLRELGLKPQLAAYAGTGAFDLKGPRFQPDYAKDVKPALTQLNIMRFYSRHPGRFLHSVWLTIKKGLALRPPLHGNFAKSAGRPPAAQSSTFAIWSALRDAVLPRLPILMVLIFTVHISVAASLYRRTSSLIFRSELEWQLLLPVLAATQLILVAVFDGIGDTVKHMFLFNLCVDYMLIALTVQLIGIRTGTLAGESRDAVETGGVL